jgi:hypothetical protein
MDKVRVVRPPRIRKRAKPPKADKGGGPTIEAPLSELTKDMSHIPIKDMEAWVNRSAEVRRKEVAMKNGKIARPMNSFMLYRSAYAERTKDWCAQNNHQVVSRASGQSWPLEPREIRDRFERYATIERDNHQKAHPGYKFAPNKNQNTPKKKRTHEEEGNSEIEDPDFDIRSCPRNARKKPKASEPNEGFESRHSTPFEQDSSYESRHTTPFDHCGAGVIYSNPDMNRSSWEMINPGRPLPGLLSPPEQSHYYQPSIHQSLLGPNIEDITFKKMGVPGMQYDTMGALTGLPGNAHHDLFQPPSHNGTPVSAENIQVDPQLLEFDHPQVGMPSGEGGNYGGQLDLWSMPPHPHYVHNDIHAQGEQYHPAPTFHHGIQPIMDGRNLWSIHADENQIDGGAEFDDWLSNTGGY